MVIERSSAGGGFVELYARFVCLRLYIPDNNSFVHLIGLSAVQVPQSLFQLSLSTTPLESSGPDLGFTSTPTATNTNFLQF